MEYNTKFAILGAISLMNLAGGLELISEGVSKRNTVREAIYAHEKTITPEVINRANKLAQHTGTEEYIFGLIALGAGGFIGLSGYNLARKKE